jgi:hypothetical protein
MAMTSIAVDPGALGLADRRNHIPGTGALRDAIGHLLAEGLILIGRHPSVVAAG